MASASHSRWIIAGVLLVCIVAAWWVRRRPQQYPVAYVADRAATLWSSTAQVRQTVATLGYGERVAVVQRDGDEAQVRTDDGAHGWMDAHMLMDAAMWKQIADELTLARSLPVQAIGHTRSVSNVHLQAGRDAPRIFQFGRDVPVEVLQRKVLPVPKIVSQMPGGSAEEPAPDADAGKMEDWLLVLRAPEPGSPVATSQTSSQADSRSQSTGRDIPIAGWVLGRFISLDPPQPIPDYISSAGMRVVAWAVLNTVTDDGVAKPQYLVAGTRGGEGQPCDFTLLRVYTWSTARQRYETAYVESGLCGKMPITVSQTSEGTEFRFLEVDEGGAQRLYRMKQTSVRRVKASGEDRTRPGK
jgi:hypothetical protein